MATEGSATLPTDNAPQTTISMASNIAPMVPVPPSTTANKLRAEISERVASCRGRWMRDVCIAQGRPGTAKQGQGKEGHTCPKNRLSDVSPPTDALSSQVQHRDGEEDCISAGEPHPSGEATTSASTQTCRATTSRLPGAVESLRALQPLSREPWVEHRQHEPATEPRKSLSSPSKVRGRFQ